MSKGRNFTINSFDVVSVLATKSNVASTLLLVWTGLEARDYAYRIKIGKEAYLYSAFYILCISLSAQLWITVLPANAPCLPFLRMRSLDGATSN